MTWVEFQTSMLMLYTRSMGKLNDHSTCQKRRLKAGKLAMKKMVVNQAGRSSYIAADKLALPPDPGALATAAWYRAVALTLKSLSCHSVIQNHIALFQLHLPSKKFRTYYAVHASP